jgi:hypothetical protein
MAAAVVDTTELMVLHRHGHNGHCLVEPGETSVGIQEFIWVPGKRLCDGVWNAGARP